MNISDAIIPLIITVIAINGLYKKTDVFSEFARGAEEGLMTSVKILPQLVGLLVAVRAFSASGALGLIENAVAPLARLIHFPPELVPFALLRPISGSGSLAMATDIFSRFGPDSFMGRAVSVMMGSSETTFYTVAVYFGAVKAKSVRHSLMCALFADAVSAFVSVAVCRVMF